MELHLKPGVYLPERRQRAEGDAAVLLFYAVFTPLTTLLGSCLVEGLGWNEYLVTGINMALNLATEYLYDTFVVFRGSIDTNKRAKRG